MKKWFQEWIHSPLQYLLSWQWVKRFLYWLVVSAGTVSECVFLIASLWVSVNATVHPLMLKLMSQATTVTFTQLAVSAFTSLPEVILGLAVVTTYGHIKFYCVHRKNSSLTWALLFGMPTVVFASLTIWTLAASALQIGYEMPSVLIATRVLAGYAYGFLSMLFVLIGEPDTADYVSRLNADVERLTQELDRTTQHFEDALQTANSNFQTAMQSKQSEYEYRINSIVEQGKSKIESLQNQLEDKSTLVQKLSERASSLERDELALFPNVKVLWLEKAKSRVSIDEIVEATGLSKQRIRAAINGGKIARDNRNKDLFKVSSVIEWLKTIPVNSVSQNHSNGHMEDEESVFDLPVLTMID